MLSRRAALVRLHARKACTNFEDFYRKYITEQYSGTNILNYYFNFVYRGNHFLIISRGKFCTHAFQQESCFIETSITIIGISTSGKKLLYFYKIFFTRHIYSRFIITVDFAPTSQTVY